MKIIRFAWMAALMAVFSASCARELAPQDTGVLIINAVASGIGAEPTRAHGSYGYEVLWDKDDRIVVTDGALQDSLHLVEGEGKSLGKFCQDGSVPLSGEVTGYYPASILQRDGSILWPSRQQYSPDKTCIGLLFRYVFGLYGARRGSGAPCHDSCRGLLRQYV